jgi:hypothetical protein
MLVVVCGLIRKNGWSCLASSAGLALPFWKAQARALSLSLPMPLLYLPNFFLYFGPFSEKKSHLDPRKI